MINSFFKHTFAVAIVCILATSSVQADIEYLNTAFGQGNGYVTLSNGIQVEFDAIAVQADGKIVVAGSTNDFNSRILIARYSAEGIIDTSFGTNGFVVTNVGTVNSETAIASIGILSDGRIVVAGSTFDTGVSTSVLLACYNSNGTLDTAFGSSGFASLLVGDGSAANALLVQSDDKIVIAGVAIIGGNVNGLLARFSSSGSLDSANFGSGGYVTTFQGNSTQWNGVTIDGSGNLFVTGVSDQTGDQYIVSKFSSAGALVTGFGTSGYVFGALSNTSRANAIARDSSGNIIIVGGTNDGTDDLCLVVRLTSSGALDTSFNSVGYVTQLLGTSSTLNTVTIQSDDKIIPGGFGSFGVLKSFVERFTTSGSLDSTYGDSGVVMLPFNNDESVSASVKLNSEGRALVAGSLTALASDPVGFLANLNKNNTDDVTITSIAAGNVYTTVPTLSGTSSAASEQVRVTINGVVFTTVSTDGSGNWNAGRSSVLPAGTNYIRVDLIVSSVVVVSSEIAINVIPNFGDDAVFAYDTTTQTLSGSFADVTFNTNADIITWSHTTGTASFTCNQAGKYKIEYEGVVQLSSNGAVSGSMRLVKNGTEIAGSGIPLALSVTSTLGIARVVAGSNQNLTASIITTLAANDVIKLQALGSNAQLAPMGSATTKPSASLVITRLG